VKHFVFCISGGPLSWHLTADEKSTIRFQWPTTEIPKDQNLGDKELQARQHNDQQLRSLKAFIAAR